MTERLFRIDGMRCGGCVNGVLSVLKTLPGVEVEEVSVGRARVRLDPTNSTQAQLLQALDQAGYPAQAE